MDIVLLTGSAGDIYLEEQPVRVTAIEEDEYGDLTVSAEEILVGTPYIPPPPTRGYYFEVTINALFGAFYGAPGELQIGFANAGYNLDAPGGFARGDLGAVLTGSAAGTDANSFGWYCAAFLGTGYYLAGGDYFGGFGIPFNSYNDNAGGYQFVPGTTYGFLLDVLSGCAFWRRVMDRQSGEQEFGAGGGRPRRPRRLHTRLRPDGARRQRRANLDPDHVVLFGTAQPCRSRRRAGRRSP
jgi:hypothetical protein